MYICLAHFKSILLSYTHKFKPKWLKKLRRMFHVSWSKEVRDDKSWMAQSCSSVFHVRKKNSASVWESEDKQLPVTNLSSYHHANNSLDWSEISANLTSQLSFLVHIASVHRKRKMVNNFITNLGQRVLFRFKKSYNNTDRISKTDSTVTEDTQSLSKYCASVCSKASSIICLSCATKQWSLNRYSFISFKYWSLPHNSKRKSDGQTRRTWKALHRGGDLTDSPPPPPTPPYVTANETP